MTPSPRRCLLLRGSPAETAARAAGLVAGLPGAHVLWIGADPPPGVVSGTRGEAGARLGASFDAVVLDLHGGVDAELLGQGHGFVWGGGALVVRMGPADAPVPPAVALCVSPYGPETVGERFHRRVERWLPPPLAPDVDAPLTRAEHARTGSAEQARVVDELARFFLDAQPACVSLVADRGRGKSAALGLALHAAALERASRGESPLRIAVTAARPEAAAEVLRFAGPGFVFVELTALLEDSAETRWDALVVDEAAQLPVPLLQALTLAHPAARVAFATTAHGYEGTGRGFILRFLAWAHRQPRPLRSLTLTGPIRWAPDDPLERLIHGLLVLDAEPAPLPEGSPAAAPDAPPVLTIDDPADLHHEVLDRDALAADEPLLRAFFGLLVHAHYRTTPGDLHRALDAPNLALHALRWRGHVVAASLVAFEGGLAPALCADMARGRVRIRGHALADTLVTHAGRPEAGAMTMVRSVRIATHPGLRRLGLARRLVEGVHATYAPDLFGTLFGATAELLAFRRAVGYSLVRVGVSRGERSGEPAAVMVRPVSARAQALVATLRANLSRSLPLQLDLQSDARDLLLDPALRAALLAELPTSPALPSDAEVAAAVEAYLSGPQPFEGSAWALTPWLAARLDALDRLSPRERALLQARVLDRLPWRATARLADYESVTAAMRALRPALRRVALSAPCTAP